MNILKKAVNYSLSALGYEIRRVPDAKPDAKPDVRYENFVNLAQAYEQNLNDSNKLISENDVRPRLLARLLGTPPSEAYFIVQALGRCKDVNGDVCEFGVAQGETSALIANEIASIDDKVLHLFDSFEGLPMPTEKDKLKDDIFSLGNIEAYAGTMSCPEDLVINRMKALSFSEQRYIIHKGFIEQSLQNDDVLPEVVSFAYVDFDFYEPIKIALEFLHTRTPNGAIIIVDDYNYFSTGVKTSVDEFISEKNSKELYYSCFVPDTRYGYFAVLTKEINNISKG